MLVAKVAARASAVLAKVKGTVVGVEAQETSPGLVQQHAPPQCLQRLGEGRACRTVEGAAAAAQGKALEQERVRDGLRLHMTGQGQPANCIVHCVGCERAA